MKRKFFIIFPLLWLLCFGWIQCPPPLWENPIPNVNPVSTGIAGDYPLIFKIQTHLSRRNIKNILFLGIDRTEERYNTMGAYRTDSIFIVSIQSHRKRINVLAIPRDTLAWIDCINRKDKICHAYVWGGMGERGIQSSLNSINRFIQYSGVDCYFAIDMEPLPEIIDQLGGIDLDVDVDMKTHGFNLSKGFQHLDGKAAEQFIRWRLSGAGDIDRLKRQQKLVLALAGKLKHQGRLADSIFLLWKYRKYIQTNMNCSQFLELAKLWMNIPEGNYTFYIIPGESRMIHKVWYWVPDEAGTREMLSRIFQN